MCYMKLPSHVLTGPGCQSTCPSKDLFAGKETQKVLVFGTRPLRPAGSCYSPCGRGDGGASVGWGQGPEGRTDEATGTPRLTAEARVPGGVDTRRQAQADFPSPTRVASTTALQKTPRPGRPGTPPSSPERTRPAGTSQQLSSRALSISNSGPPLPASQLAF